MKKHQWLYVLSLVLWVLAVPSLGATVTQIRRRTISDVVSLSWDGLHAALYSTHEAPPNVTLQLQTRNSQGEVIYSRFPKQLSFLAMPSNFDSDSLKYVNQEQIKPSFIGTQFVHIDPLTRTLFIWDVSQYNAQLPFKKLRKYELDTQCYNNCVYQKNYPTNKKYRKDGIIFIRNTTTVSNKTTTKNVQIKLKVPDANALISLEQYDSPIIFKTVRGIYEIYNFTSSKNYEHIKQIQTKAQGLHLPALVIVNKNTILYKKCFGGEFNTRARIMRYNPITNESSYFSKNIYKSCQIGLYLSKNRKFVGILENTPRQSTFRLYDFNTYQIEMSKQIYVASDLKIVEATSIVSLDISEDGSRIAYVRQVHQGRQYEYVVTHHDLFQTDLAYPCYKNVYFVEFARYCLPNILHNSTWAEYALFAAKGLAFFLIGNFIWKLLKFLYRKVKPEPKIDPKQAKRQSINRRKSEQAAMDQNKQGKKAS